MRSILRAGPVGTRLVYRWLRRRPRVYVDTYVVIEWPETAATLPARWYPARILGPALPEPPPELPGPVWEALRAFEMPGKLLESWPNSVEIRTRCWHRHPWLRASYDCLRHDTRIDHGDRATGMWFARLLAALLRAAHREGFPLTVRGFR